LLLRTKQNVGGIYLADNQPNMAKNNKEATTATRSEARKTKHGLKWVKFLPLPWTELK